jgi:chromosome segregation ATPase
MPVPCRTITTMMTLNEFEQYPSVLQPARDLFQKKDQKIQRLDWSLRHQLSIAKKTNIALKNAQQELQDKEMERNLLEGELRGTRTELGRLREKSREERVGISRLKSDVKAKEMDFLNKENSAENMSACLREKIKELEGQRAELEIGNVGLKERILELQNEVGALGKERDGLVKEIKKLMDGTETFRKRDTEISSLRQEREEYYVDKGNSIREREELRKGHSDLLKRIDGLEIQKAHLGETIERQITTISDLQRDMERDDSYIKRIKKEREEWNSKADNLGRENKRIKRKITEATAIFSSDVGDVDELPAKRPRTLQGVKDDSHVVEGSRWSVPDSPDTPRSMLMSSPNDARHEQLPGNEVRKVEFFSLELLLNQMIGPESRLQVGSSLKTLPHQKRSSEKLQVIHWCCWHLSWSRDA